MREGKTMKEEREGRREDREERKEERKAMKRGWEEDRRMRG